MRVRSERIPGIGDKYASRYGQKATTGALLPAEDMPYTKSGMVPDLIINPCCLPTRQTVGQLLEMFTGKVGALKGKYVDGTPFKKMEFEELNEVLKEYGFEEHGNETLYCGFTGKKMESQIFIGPTYYFRLKHMVLDKIHCLTAEHDVLTTEGWIAINKINVNHKVATLNNNKLVYTNPINIFHYEDYEGKMYNIKNKEIDLDVTLNHRMYIKIDTNGEYILEKAENIIGKRVIYKNNAIYEEIDEAKLIITTLIGDGNEYITDDVRCADVFMKTTIHAGWSSIIEIIDNKFMRDKLSFYDKDKNDLIPVVSIVIPPIIEA
jgi:hypothetical protein